MTARTRWLSRLIWIATLLLLLALIGLSIGDSTTEPDELPYVAAAVLGMLAFGTVA